MSLTQAALIRYYVFRRNVIMRVKLDLSACYPTTHHSVYLWNYSSHSGSSGCGIMANTTSPPGLHLKVRYLSLPMGEGEGWGWPAATQPPTHAYAYMFSYSHYRWVHSLPRVDC